MTGKTGWALGLGTMAVLLAGVVLWAAWSTRVESESLDRSPPANTAAAEHVVVEMEGLTFKPSRLEIPAGTVVTFVNRDPVTHNVVQTTPSQLGRNEALFSSPRLEPGQTWSFRFDEPGRYPILCLDGGHYAVGMLGSITVYPAEGTAAAAKNEKGSAETGAEPWAEEGQSEAGARTAAIP